MRKKALHKDFFIEIKKTKNRYISLLLIVALGVAFFSGVRGSDPDMRLSADQYYDDSNLMDIRVLGTLGLTKDDVTAIQDIKGVKDVMPAYSADVLCSLSERQMVLKMMSVPATVNQISVTAGRLPEAENECLVDDNFFEQTEYEIGDTITVEPGTGADVKDTLSVTEFTIVGAGNTSYYLSLDRGSSSIGGGTVDSFVVIPESAFSLEVYTEVYVTVQGASELTSYTDDYDDIVDVVVERIEAIADARSQVRYNDIVVEAEEAIADAEGEITDAEAKLADAKAEIEQGKTELESAKAEITSKTKELEEVQATLKSQESALSQGETEVNNGWSTIASQRTELESGKAQLAAAEEEWQAGKTALEAGRQELEVQAQDAAQKLESVRYEREGLIGRLTEIKSAYELNQDESLAEQIGELEAGIAQLEKAITDGEANIAAGWQKLAEEEAALEAARTQLDSRSAQLAQGETEIASAEQLLNSKQAEINSGKSQITSAKQTIANGWTQLDNAKEEIANATAELSDGEAEYTDAVAENEPKIADAKQKIEDAKEELEKLEVPEWYVLSRQFLQAYVEYGQNADRIGAIGTVFPVIFFLVAALVCLTTMTRMVEEQRTQIGTLKALGYSKAGIAGKYILYALSASLLGSLIGLFIGQKVFPAIIINAYKIMYETLPDILTPLNFEYSVTSTAMAVICTTGAAVFACYKELVAVPAELMRPAAPKAGKRVLLERARFIWRHLNFSMKSTIRNLFRYKKRFFMTIIGIGGCTALLLVGFGLKDSITSIGSLQFSNVHIYDSEISLANDITEEDSKALAKMIENDNDIVDAMRVDKTTMDAGYGNVEKNAYLLIPEDPGGLHDYVLLQDRISREPYELTDEGVIITEKLAKLLGVNTGDTIYLKDGETSKVEVTIIAITENYFFHYIYMSPAVYEALFNEVPIYGEIFTNNVDNSEAFEEVLGTRYIDIESVAGVSFVSTMASGIADMLQSLDIITYVLVISAGLLAFIVLHNLNNINVSERMRELATLKVLGFYDGEVSQYVVRENVWLTGIGIFAGLFMGKLLHQYVILTAEVDMTMFGRNIELHSYLFSILLTFVFSGIVNLIMHFKLKKINMVESMKSVE